MKFFYADENTWLYPDIAPEQRKVELYLARGGHAGLQLWCDVPSSGGGDETLTVTLPEGVECEYYRLYPAYVEENSAPDRLTTLDYEKVKDFVTRRAPFYVYDITADLNRGKPCGEIPETDSRGYFLRFAASADAHAFSGEITVTLIIGVDKQSVTLPLMVTMAKVPSLSETDFGINNWLTWSDIAASHGVKPRTPEFYEVVDSYFDTLRELRSNHLLLPSGAPVRDENGRIVDFDFSYCEEVAERALAKGFAYVYGGFVARFIQWDAPEVYLNWDRKVDVCTQEGFRQLRLYFRKLWQVITSHGWQDRWMQCLEDEPQFPNSMAYRAMACICRQCMPGVTIHDPVESTETLGGMDIWCIKQEVYDKYRETFRDLQAQGEQLWVYTCGFPAGKWMNRAMDLPLLSGRLVFWMCAKEGFGGFLHWGFNAYGNVNPYTHSCYPVGERTLLPPGDGFIVYPDKAKGGAVLSIRAQGQLFGAEDAELLRQLSEERRAELCAKLCRSFEEYESDPDVFASVRRELLTAWD